MRERGTRSRERGVSLGGDNVRQRRLDQVVGAQEIDLDDAAPGRRIHKFHRAECGHTCVGPDDVESSMSAESELRGGDAGGRVCDIEYDTGGRAPRAVVCAVRAAVAAPISPAPPLMRKT